MKITLEKQLANKKYYKEHKEQICEKKRKQYYEKIKQFYSKDIKTSE